MSEEQDTPKPDTRTFEERAVDGVKALTKYLADGVPELQGFAVVFDWQEHLQGAAVPFVWSGLTDDSQKGLPPDQLQSMGGQVEKLLRYRTEMLGTYIQKLSQHLKHLQAQQTVMRMNKNAQGEISKPEAESTHEGGDSGGDPPSSENQAG